MNTEPLERRTEAPAEGELLAPESSVRAVPSPRCLRRGRSRLLVLAWSILILVGMAWGYGLVFEDAGTPRGRAQAAFAPPALQCPTGYDERGRCVLEGLLEGVRCFLGPGLLAGGIAVLGGLLAGLMVGYARPAFRAPAGLLLTTLDALPRLGVMVVVYLSSDHSLTALGLALGVTSIPALAWPLAERIARLEQKRFLDAARTHGLRESFIVRHHLLWLSCRGLVVRQALMVLGLMLVVESSLSYALWANLSPDARSWGYQLQRTTSALYALVPSQLPGAESLPLLVRLGRGPVQFLSIAFCMGTVLWSVQVLSEWLARTGEEPR